MWQRAIADRLLICVERFSLGSLFKTLFAPYKQTVAGKYGKGIGAFFWSAIDSMISRFVGSTVRFTLIVAGGINVLFVLVSGMVMVIIMPLVPILVLVSIISGWWLPA